MEGEEGSKQSMMVCLWEAGLWGNGVVLNYCQELGSLGFECLTGREGKKEQGSEG